MPKNQSKAILTVNVTASAAITANRFVTAGGALAAANSTPIGVARTNAASGELFAADVVGITTCIASAAIADNARLNVAANGQVVTASSTHPVVGIALGEATAAGHEITVLLIQT